MGKIVNKWLNIDSNNLKVLPTGELTIQTTPTFQAGTIIDPTAVQTELGKIGSLSFGIIINNDFDYIEDGLQKGVVFLKNSVEISQITILSNVACDISLEVYMSDVSNYPISTSLSNGDYLSLSSQVKYVKTDYSAWATTTLPAGTILTFEVLPNSTATFVQVIFEVTTN